jgi:hypothetical protein
MTAMPFSEEMMSMALFDLPPISCQLSVMARPVSFLRFRIKYWNQGCQGPMYYFLNIFAENFSEKIGVFDSKQS